MKHYENAARRESMHLKINCNNRMKGALIPDGFTADAIKAPLPKSAFAGEPAGVDAFDRLG